VTRSQPTPSCAQRDLLASRSGLWFWGLPAFLLIVGVLWGGVRAPLWSVAFLVGGTACVANAARCGRAHCYLTGPLYLGLAAVSALIGVRFISWSWWWVGAAFLIGTLLAYVPEFLGKRYVHGSSSPGGGARCG
jgi:hypothetical protein